jgi:ABC-type lipoprotein export system ATPase subunit
MTQLQSFTVFNLLGQFNHHVSFKNDADFVIVHGPNGVGKTRMLELLSAVLKFDLVAMSTASFDRISLAFTGGERLTVTNNAQRAMRESEGRRFLDLSFNLNRKKNPTAMHGRISIPRDDLPYSVWRDIQVELAQAFETDASPSAKLQVLEHTGQAYSPTTRRMRGVSAVGFVELHDFDRGITEFLDGFSAHMVETQRLLILDPGADARMRQPDSTPQRMKVSECARDLKHRLAAALTENSRRSQELDKSFPRRVLDEMAEEPVPEELRIREEYAEQSTLRNRLAAIALLDESMDVLLPGGELLDWQRKVLWTYLQDSQLKLATFQDLLNRVELFKSIIKSRFLFKRMVIDRQTGFRFESEDGHHHIAPSQLSSGEQHEIVLAYDLLFRVRPGSLVLIDEPEISLHVAWQQEFMGDIQRIAKLSNLRFIVATHSPQIINEWWAQTIGLKASSNREARP